MSMSLCVDGFHAEGLEVKQIWSINCVFNLRSNIAVKLSTFATRAGKTWFPLNSNYGF